MIGDWQHRQETAGRAMAALTGAAGLIREAGLEVEIVSAGGTGTYDVTGRYPGVTEVEAGSYILMDTRYREVGVPFRCALTLLATVISVPAPDRAVIDAGKKALTQEFGLPQVTGCPGVRLVSLSEEHGSLAVDPDLAALEIADKIELIPSHVCTTVNLHDWYFAIRDNRLEAIWPIAARGRAQ